MEIDRTFIIRFILGSLIIALLAVVVTVVAVTISRGKNAGNTASDQTYRVPDDFRLSKDTAGTGNIAGPTYANILPELNFFLPGSPLDESLIRHYPGREIGPKWTSTQVKQYWIPTDEIVRDHLEREADEFVSQAFKEVK